jgi:antitoxin component YwqK of YwqJK toxin-antitoxin module
MYKYIHLKSHKLLLCLPLSLFFLSCEVSEINPKESTNESLDSNPEANVSSSQRFLSKDRKKEEILSDYKKPLISYPAITSKESKTGKDGMVYRDGLEDPLTGRIIDRFESGDIKMDASYLDGLPHGTQIRYFDGGVPALEATFDNGRLSGIKSRWWQNGLIREEEYWSEGNYRGRRLWDESGRLIREEILP